MRYLSRLALASLVICLVTASSWTGSASGIVLCEENVGTEGSGACPSGKTLPTGTVFHAGGGAGNPVKLQTSSGEVECVFSNVLGETLERSNGTALDGDIESLTYSGCGVGNRSCTFTVEGLSYLLLLLLNGSGKYHFIAEEKNNELPRVKVVCENQIMNCLFQAVAWLYSVEFLGSNIDLVMSQQPERLGVNCPTTATWTTRYVLKCLRPAGTSVPCYPAMTEGP